MAYTFVPSTATTIAQTVVYGIADELKDYILQDINVTEDVNTIQIPDQQGAIAQVRGMQKHWNISFTAIGPNTAPGGGAGSTITFTTATGSFKAFVQSAERRATYNDTQKWSVTMEAWENAVDDSGTKLGPVGTTNP